MPLAGVVLAGGKARRMGGGDKALISIGGRSILERILAVLKPQVQALSINANGDPTRFQSYGLPVIADTIPGSAGPLAGILSGLQWCQSLPSNPAALVSVAGDSPFLPDNLAARLAAAATATAIHAPKIALAQSGGHTHPVAGLWPVDLVEPLTDYLVKGGNRKIMAFVERYNHCFVDFPIGQVGNVSLDPFLNINSPDDLKQANNLTDLLENGTVP